MVSLWRNNITKISNITMLRKMVIEKINSNKKVAAGFNVLNIPLIIIKRKNNYIPQIHVHLQLAQTNRLLGS